MKNCEKATRMNSSIKTNYEGGIGYQMNLEERLAEFFSLGLLNGNFYQSEADVLNNARDLFEEALEKCPRYATQCAIYGNNTNSLKLIPTIWLVYLSTLEDKTLFEKAFPKIIRNPKMLHDFMEISRKSGIRQGLGRNIKKVMNNWLYEKLNEYQVSRNKSKLQEVIRVTRPNNQDEIFQNYMKYVSKGELTFSRAQALKKVIDDLLSDNITKDTIKLINEHRLQLEELKHSTMNLSKENKELLYGEMYKNLNYAALILNLVALERIFATKTENIINSNAYGKFNQEQITETDIPDNILYMVVDKIRDIDAYKKSNMLPFALFNAYKQVSVPEFKYAIADMLKIVAKDSFDIDKDIDIMVAIDTSSSMQYNNISNTLNCMDVATLFGAMIKKSHTKANIYAVATDIEEVLLRKQDDVFTMADAIANTSVGYGTYFEQIIGKYNEEKYVILITDSEQADDLEKEWKRVNKKKDLKLIVWQLANYETKISNDSSVIYLAGYSDRLLSLIKNIIEGEFGQIDEIKSIII